MQLLANLRQSANSLAGSTDDQTGRILTQLTESNERIAHRIRDVQSLTEREILACGEVLSAIVEEARLLRDESDDKAASSLARSQEVTTRFIDGMRSDIVEQQAAVQRVLDLTNRIGAAIAAIDNLPLASKMLAINAKIEAARLGELGKSFEVIASGLGEFGELIRAAADNVSSSIAAVRESLPPVSARADSMDERTKLFIDAVSKLGTPDSEQAEDGQSTSRLSKLMELSNQALSHLQFQDPMIQTLRSIDRDLVSMKERIRRELNGESAAVSTPEETEAAGEPAAGEVVLF